MHGEDEMTGKRRILLVAAMFLVTLGPNISYASDHSDIGELGGAIGFSYRNTGVGPMHLEGAAQQVTLDKASDRFNFSYSIFLGAFITDFIQIGWDLPISYEEFRLKDYLFNPSIMRLEDLTVQNLEIGFNYFVRYHFTDEGSCPFLTGALGYEHWLARYLKEYSQNVSYKFDGVAVRTGFGYLFVIGEARGSLLGVRASMDFVYKRMEQRDSRNSIDQYTMMFTVAMSGLFQ